MENEKTVDRVPAPCFFQPFGALQGMRVLMTGTIVAAPVCASLLAENGAEVIHVERPGGDPYRFQSPTVTVDGEKIVPAGPEVPMNKKVSNGWIQEGRNKLSMSFNWDLRVPEAKEAFLALIRQVDVYLENIVWTEKLGIKDDELLAVNPKLVICHISGFGNKKFGEADGQSSRRSYDPIGQLEGGWMNLNGFPDGPPIYGSVFINDYITAYYSTIGVLMAYISAQATGKGQVVDVAQVESMSKGLGDCFVNYFLLGLVRGRRGNATGAFQPADLYKSKDNWLYIGSFGEPAYYGFMKAIDGDVNKFPFEQAASSIDAVNSPLGQELRKYIQDWVGARTSEEGFQHLRKHNIACAIPRTIEEVAKNPHYHARGNFIEYIDETLQKPIKAFGFVPKMGGTPQKVWRGGPRQGQDTRMILSKLANFTEEEIQGLVSKGVIDPNYLEDSLQ